MANSKQELKYHAWACVRFTEAHKIEARDRKGAKTIFLNKYRVEGTHLRRMSNWKHQKHVGLSSFEDTLFSYGLDYRDFEAWCDKQGIDPVAFEPDVNL